MENEEMEESLVEFIYRSEDDIATVPGSGSCTCSCCCSAVSSSITEEE